MGRVSRSTSLSILMLASIPLVAGACDGMPGAEQAEADEPAQAQGWAKRFVSDRVDAVLDAGERVLRTRGFEDEGGQWRGFLVAHGSEVRTATMHSGACYAISAAGSTALEELDLRVFDGDGGEVARDRMTGSEAALHYCPPQSGTFYVAVRAADGSGLFGVRRYTGPTGLGVRLDDLFAEPVLEEPSR